MTNTPNLHPRPDIARIRQSLLARGHPLSCVSKESLQELGVSREEFVSGKLAPYVPAATPSEPAPKKTRARAKAIAPSNVEPEVAAKKKKPSKSAKLSAPVVPQPEACLDGWSLPAYCDPRNLVFKVRLDLPSPSNNEMRHMHFAPYKKLRERFEAQVRTALGDYAPPKLERAALFVVRHCQSGGLDWDNAYGGLKPALDCLTKPTKSSPSGTHIIEDDNPKHMPYPPYVMQEVCKRGEGALEIFVFRLDPLDPGPRKRTTH